MSIVVYISIGLIFLFLSAIFNGSETGFVSLDTSYLKYRARSPKALQEKRLLKIAASPEKFLALTLIGINCSLVIATSVFTAVLQDFGPIYLHVGTFAISMFIFVFCEFVPKMLFSNRPLKHCLSFLPFYIVFEYIFYIPVRIISYFTRIIMDIVGLKRTYTAGKISLSELLILLGHGTSSGIIQADITEMAKGIIELKDRHVNEIMIPRTSIIGIEERTALSEAKKIILESGFSRIPIYRNEIDQIVGILYFKDLFLRDEGAKTIKQLMTEPLFVPEMKSASELFKEMRARKVQVAVVLDEFASVSGLVTFEDLVEEVVGEIYDEFDKPEISIKICEDGSIKALGSLSVNDFNDEVETVKLPVVDGATTINGIIITKLGRIPKKGERFKLGDHNVKIIESSDRMVEIIQIIPVNK